MRTLLLIPVAAYSLWAQAPAAPTAAPSTPSIAAATPAGVPPGAGNDEVLKRIDDLMWHVMLDDVAVIDKVEYTRPAAAWIRESDAPRARPSPRSSGRCV